MVDHGFSRENAGLIDQYFLFVLGVAVVLGLATAIRFYFVTWIGERIVADMRKALYTHILSLSPAFFEVTRTGEVLSRLTTDTTLIQTAVGSSVSIALRNILMMIGGLTMLFITSAKLTGLVLVTVPLGGRAVDPDGPHRAQPVARQPRSRRRHQRLCRRNDQCDADGAVLHPRTHRPPTLRRRRSRRRLRPPSGACARAPLMTALVIVLIFASIVGVLWMGAQAVLSGTMTDGELSQFILYAIMVASGAGRLVGSVERSSPGRRRGRTPDGTALDQAANRSAAQARLVPDAPRAAPCASTISRSNIRCAPAFRR